MKLFENLEFPLAFGSAAISGEAGGYGFGKISEQESIDLLHYAFNQGVQIFDTAPIYGFHSSEVRLGKAFKNQREKVLIVSKSGVTWSSQRRVDMTNDPKVTMKMLEDSLRHLNTDYIDIYMIHWPDKNIDIRYPFEILSKAKKQGKIKYLGLCNTFEEELKKAGEVDSVDVVQGEFNIFERQQSKLFDYLNKEKIPFMSWGCLEKGILTGQVTLKRTFDKCDCRSWAPWWKQSNKDEKINIFQETIKPWCEENDISFIGLALGFVLKQSLNKIIPICGGRTILQWDGILNSLKEIPSQEKIDELLELLK